MMKNGASGKTNAEKFRGAFFPDLTDFFAGTARLQTYLKGKQESRKNTLATFSCFPTFLRGIS
jgi:hypothetical protein